MGPKNCILSGDPSSTLSVYTNSIPATSGTEFPDYSLGVRGWSSKEGIKGNRNRGGGTRNNLLINLLPSQKQ